MKGRGCVTLVVTLVLALPAGAGDETAEVLVGRKRLAVDELPEDWPLGTAAACDEWVPWAVANDFEARLLADGRVLFLSDERGGAARRRTRVIEESVERFDELLPIHDPGEEPEDDSHPFGGPDFVPEDPEDELGSVPFGATSAVAEPEAPVEVDVWSEARDWVPDAFPIVVAVTAGRAGYDRLLDRIHERRTSLRDWCMGAKARPAFVLEQPVTGGVQAEPEDLDDYELEHELANRVGRLLLIRRYGSLPNWIEQGFGWEVERLVTDEIAAFPFRVEEEEGDEDWERALKEEFEDRKDRPLSVDDFAHWSRESYSGAYARIGWALVAQLARRDPAAFDGYLLDLRRHWDKHNRSYTADGRWRRLRSYQTEVGLQRSLLEERFGADVWRDVTDAILGGRVTER